MKGRKTLGIKAHLEHAAHAKLSHFAERLQRNLRELLDEAAKRSRHERLCRSRHLGVDEHQGQKRFVDELVDLCRNRDNERSVAFQG